MFAFEKGYNIFSFPGAESENILFSGSAPAIDTNIVRAIDIM